MTAAMQTISAEHLQAAVDAVLGFDASQAPTDPTELSERLTIQHAGVTEAMTFLFSHQQSKNAHRAAPLVYVVLEAANRAYPELMKEELKSKTFVTSIATAAADAHTAAKGSGVEGITKTRQPVLAAFIEKQLGADGAAAKLSLDDRTGLWALALGAIRAVDRHLQGPDKPVQVTKQPGPNEPCSCGSGKKFKKCHGGPNPPTP
jgi:hypothetical protein